MKRFSNWLIEIRPYRLRDKPLLIEAINAVCAEGRWMESLRYEPTPAWEHALARSDRARYLLLVAVHRDQIAGWCRAFPDGSQNSAEIGIGLLKQYRDQGVGTRFLRETICWAKRSGFSCLKLRTRSDNTRAIHFFRRLGFVSTGWTEQEQIEMVRHLAEIDCNEEAEL